MDTPHYYYNANYHTGSFFVWQRISTSMNLIAIVRTLHNREKIEFSAPTQSVEYSYPSFSDSDKSHTLNLSSWRDCGKNEALDIYTIQHKI